MINERKYDKINPVRIELRDNSTLWLVGGYEGKNDFGQSFAINGEKEFVISQGKMLNMTK